MNGEYTEIRYEIADGIATITIDRPAVRNAFTEQTIAELCHAIDEFQKNECAHVAILTGTDDGFCAGADVTEMPDWSAMGKEAYGEFLGSVQDVVRGLRWSTKPTIAAVAGPAVGAGCDFALACDFRFVGPDALLREGFVNVGLIPGDGGAWLLPRLIGESKAREYLFTGRDITPGEAVKLGLAVEEAENPLAAAREFAAELLDLPVVGLRRTKALIDPHQSFEEYCEKAIDYQWECINDLEHVETVAAFQEGREPEFNRDYS